MTQEELRLAESGTRKKHWKRWGPYLSERAWGTVREDYSADGNAWAFFPHDHARSRAYRWNEDGLAGICDRHQMICFALALWNGTRPYPEGAALRPDRKRGQPRRGREGILLLSRFNTPTHSYMKYAVQVSAGGRFPTIESGGRKPPARQRTIRNSSCLTPASSTKTATSMFSLSTPRLTSKISSIAHHGCESRAGSAPIHLLPTIWFRNTWSWKNSASDQPRMMRQSRQLGRSGYRTESPSGRQPLALLRRRARAALYRKRNQLPPPVGYAESNRLCQRWHQRLRCSRRGDAVNPEHTGTKAAAHYQLTVGRRRNCHGAFAI